MAATPWLRLWSDMPNDPKWRTIARASKQSISTVIAVYLHILVNASGSDERGTLQGLCNEDVASALDIDCEQVDAIVAAMQGRVLDGESVTGWEKRQPAREREDNTNAERQRAFRAKQNQVTPSNATVTTSNTEKSLEEIREDKSNTPIPPSGAEEQIPEKQKTSAITLHAWLDSLKVIGEKPIPEDDAVFSYAEKVGIPPEHLRLCWREFRERYSQPGAKRYRDWRSVFRKAVRGNWFNLWWVDGNGNYELTTCGKQAEKVAA